MKQCTCCGKIKEVGSFHLDKNTKDGRHSRCAECRSLYEHARREKNGDVINERKRKRYAVSPELRIRNREKCRQWQKDNRKQINERAKVWYSKHPENARACTAQRSSTPQGKLNNSMKGNMWQSIKSVKSRRRWEDLAGYTVEQLKKYLESKFTPEMNWDNYGTIWEIDHKIPIAVFNYERPEDIDFRICWALKNLQPLGCANNRSKQDKITQPFQPSLTLSVGT